MKKLAILLAAISLTLSACKETDQDKVADAQSCLDEAGMATAQQCVDMVAGIETKGAYLIRCSALFIQEGFMDANRLSNAMDAIENNGGANGSTAMMEVLAFTQFADNAAAANTAVDYCDRAGSKGLVMLASVTSIATTAKALSGVTVDDGLNDIITAGPSSPAAVAVGNAAIAAYESNCAGDGGSFGQFCDQFSSAIGGLTDPGQIGVQLATCYTAPATPGCEGF